MSWISGNRYLSQSEMENNAVLVYQYLASYGWTIEAISAVLGNMQSESSINPGIWEGLTAFSGGYGLVQWTPYSKYKDWAGSGWMDNGDLECSRIVYEFNNGLQWTTQFAWQQYKMPQGDFPYSTQSPEYLAWVWLQCYERPANFDQPVRAQNARRWYTYLTGEEPPIPPQPQPPDPETAGHLPIWLLFKMKELNT